LGFHPEYSYGLSYRTEYFDSSLYIVYLFIGKFVLTYISMVSPCLCGPLSVNHSTKSGRFAFEPSAYMHLPHCVSNIPRHSLHSR
jgi:hypothetical protein